MRTQSYVYGVEPLDGHDAWQLFTASAIGNLPAVKELLKRDQRLANAQYWYQFPIHGAVKGGHTEVVRVLLENGADPGQSRYTYNSWNRLLLSARQNGYREIELLLIQSMQSRFGYSVDFVHLRDAIIARDQARIDEVLQLHPTLAGASDEFGNNPLHWAVITRQLHLIDQFVMLGTTLNALRADGNSPILLAVNGATDYWYRETRPRTHPSLRDTSVLVGSLLAHGAEYSISVACAVGDQEQVLRLLLDRPDLATRLDSARLSPLTYAARSGYSHIVQTLLDTGANPNLPEECAPEGRALYEACCGNHLVIARMLLERGANPNAGVDSCECCLTIAELYHGERAKPLQDLLLQYGAILPPYRMSNEELKRALRENQPVIHHEEFLRCAMQNCDEELLDLLLISDPTVIQQLEVSDELTCLKNPILVATLLSKGLNPTRPDWLGNTLLETCAEIEDHPLTRLFRNDST